MSYDIYLLDPVTKEVLTIDHLHFMRGGTYCATGSDQLHLNVTYNYAKIYYKTMGEKGIRTIYGMSGVESMPILENAIKQLADDKTENYWEPTEGNAKAALIQLMAIARFRPDGIWKGD